MKDLENVINELKKGRQIELTWSATFVVTKIMAIAALVASIVFLVNLTNISEKTGYFLAFIIFLNVYACLNFYFTSKASLKGKMLSIKKIFREEKEIPIDTIVRIWSFALKSTYYTIIKYELEGKIDWALIINSNSWIFGRELSAADILKAAKKTNWNQ